MKNIYVTILTDKLLKEKTVLLIEKKSDLAIMLGLLNERFELEQIVPITGIKDFELFMKDLRLLNKPTKMEFGIPNKRGRNK